MSYSRMNLDNDDVTGQPETRIAVFFLITSNESGKIIFK